MTSEEFCAFAREYSFTKFADIVNRKGKLAFINEADVQKTGFVYIWVEIQPEATEIRIVYVGKAGRTLKERCAQHIGGFRGGSKAGKRNAARLVDGLAKGCRYEVYSRWSEREEVLGERDVSMCCVEEVAMIKKLKPTWNNQLV